MTAGVSTTLNEIEIFRSQSHTIEVVVGLNLEGITQEESLAQPKPAGNCINWVLGHLIHVYNNVSPLLGEKPVMGNGQLEPYRRGSAPLVDHGKMVPWDELLTAWQESVNRINLGLRSLSPETLRSPAPYSPTNNPNETVRSLLSAIFFHQAYHAGQLGLLRRLIGKKGAIA